MSDEDLRRGYRAIVSGGLYGLGDAAVAALAGACAKAQRERGIRPTLDELDYLQKFTEICCDFLGDDIRKIDGARAKERLAALNKEYAHLESPDRKTLRQRLPGQHLAAGDDDEGWVPSEICW